MAEMPTFRPMTAGELRRLRAQGYRVLHPNAPPRLEEMEPSTLPEPRPMGRGMQALTQLRDTLNVPTAHVFDHAVAGVGAAMGGDYDAELNRLRSESAQYAREHQWGAGAAKWAGILGASVPVSKTVQGALSAATSLPEMMGISGFLGSLYGATDAAMTGEDVRRGAVEGGAGGVLGGAAVRAMIAPRRTARELALGEWMAPRVGSMDRAMGLTRENMQRMSEAGVPVNRISVGAKANLPERVRRKVDAGQVVIDHRDVASGLDHYQAEIDDIWRSARVDTGNPDRYSRVVIPDDAADWTPQAASRIEAGKPVGGFLGDIFSHPELYRAHPQLRGISTIVDPRSPDSWYDGGALNMGIRGGAGRGVARTDAIHEIQHGVQDLEGFGKGAGFAGPAPGSTPAQADRFYSSLARKMIEGAQERYAFNIPKYIDLKDAILSGDAKAKSDAYNTLSRFPEGYDAYWSIINLDRLNKGKPPLSLINRNPISPEAYAIERYRLSSGEIESNRAEKLADVPKSGYSLPENRPSRSDWYGLPNVIERTKR